MTTPDTNAAAVWWEVRAKRIGRPHRVIGRYQSKAGAEAIDTPDWADYSYVSESPTCKHHLQVAATAIGRTV